MRRFLFLSVLLAGFGMLFGTGGAQAQPLSQLPSIMSTDSAGEQSLLQDVKYKYKYISYCVWRKSCYYVQKCYWKNGYRYCKPVYVCKRYCEKHYKLRRIFYLPHLYLRYGY